MDIRHENRQRGQWARSPWAHCHAPRRSLFISAKAGHSPADTVTSCSTRTAPRLSKHDDQRVLNSRTPSGGKFMTKRVSRRAVNTGIGAALISPALAATRAVAQAGPIKIGFGMALTGPLAVNGQQALLGSQIWAEEINAKGGLLGRQVELVFYDDQSNPSTIPGIYTKLLDVDKVDLILSGYATNMIAPAIPVVMQKNKVFISLFGLDANSEFHYPGYLSFIPTAGPNPKQTIREGFFQVAAAQNPKPQTVAIAAEDAEFSRNAAEGARANAKQYGFKVIYDKTYPPNSTDFSPII